MTTSALITEAQREIFTRREKIGKFALTISTVAMFSTLPIEMMGVKLDTVLPLAVAGGVAMFTSLWFQQKYGNALSHDRQQRSKVEADVQLNLAKSRTVRLARERAMKRPLRVLTLAA